MNSDRTADAFAAAAAVTFPLYPEGPVITLRPADLKSDADVEQILDIEIADSLAFTGAAERHTIAQRRALLQSSPMAHMLPVVAEMEMLEGGTQIVGFDTVFAPRLDNTDTIFSHQVVHPAMRRQGIGRALAQYALDIAHATGRTKTSVFATVREGEDMDLEAGVILARRAGLKHVSTAGVRVCDLPISEDALARMQDAIGEQADGYSIEIVQDPIPEDLLEDWGAMLAQLDIDDPDEDYEAEVPTYTPERIRASEKRRADGGVRRVTAIARHIETGRAVAHTYIDFSDHPETTLARQENTLVMPEHRRRGLARAVKLALHRELATIAPHLTRIITYNSHINDSMIHINEQLGYRRIGSEYIFQGPVPERLDGPAGDSRAV
ncbi:GNAT family N-acetyltransferase [Helcobacillus massiliensis]|uniref:GNAT superfamily N-acetyltransferase n=1 Tax=Helcobacillus massiliensis TaxID=521392 RepID=A0A839QT16_9MICO|nr:GNAT family N-acetyltransferase [Helcobacillus massiliensis]MBB3021890.1 GNAT superfamily N-acetyltransferase [Helcobacillus massiliensis]